MVAITPLPIDEVLPEDVIIEILTNLHPDDLSVCLEINHKFNQLVNDPCIKSRQSKALCGYLIHNGHTYSFLPDQLAMKCSEVFDNLEILKQRYTTVEAVSQCRGLVCCVLGGYRNNRRYYVCKPATGQCRAIPNPKLRFETAATAIVASLSGQEFKIVRFSLPRSGRSLYLRCEVFDSRAWRWHRCNDINQDIRFPGDWRRDGAVFAHGSMHWFTQQGIFAFNMHKETWKLIALPVEFKDFENKHHVKITLRDAKLSLVCINHDDQVVVRRMNRYFEEEWGPQEVVCFSNAQIQDDSWLRIFIDLIYSSSFSPNSLSNYKWEGVWKDRLNAKDANKSFLGGDVFRFQSDSTPFVGSLNQSIIDARLNNLKSLGFSQDEVTTLVSKNPLVLNITDEKMCSKIQFLIKDVGCDMLQLVKNPTLLMSSLEKRLIPRSLVLKLLETKGLPVAKRGSLSFARQNEKQFLEKIVLPYEHTISGLHRAYTDAVSGNISN